MLGMAITPFYRGENWGTESLYNREHLMNIYSLLKKIFSQKIIVVNNQLLGIKIKKLVIS